MADAVLAKEVHRRVLVVGLTLDVIACNMLVDMYANYGDTTATLQCFRNMSPAKYEVSWNTMISVHAHAGEHRESVAMFQETLMQLGQGACRDDATFMAISSGPVRGSVLSTPACQAHMSGASCMASTGTRRCPATGMHLQAMSCDDVCECIGSWLC